MEIKIDDDKFINFLKNIKNLYKVTATGLLFPASTVNDTNQMFVTLCELNKAKIFWGLLYGQKLLRAETFAIFAHFRESFFNNKNI